MNIDQRMFNSLHAVCLIFKEKAVLNTLIETLPADCEPYVIKAFEHYIDQFTEEDIEFCAIHGYEADEIYGKGWKK